MRCAWKQFIALLPPWMREEVDVFGRDTLQELRLRKGFPPQLIMKNGMKSLSRPIAEGDLSFCINAASQYSPWAASTVSKGYLTAPGGHRIGLCGEAVVKNGQVETIKQLRSICIRVARDFTGIGAAAPVDGSLLILGAPGWGKTTLLRDLIRIRSDRSIQIGVVDERGELFPGDVFYTGQCTDILTGCSKAEGIHMLLRTMGPICIAVDEITQPEDCSALIQAAGCGVALLATAHASKFEDLKKRSVYRPLLKSGIFDHVLILRPDKSWALERMQL